MQLVDHRLQQWKLHGKLEDDFKAKYLDYLDGTENEEYVTHNISSIEDIEEKIDPKEIFPNDPRDVYTDIQGLKMQAEKRDTRDQQLRHIYYNLPTIANQSQTNILEFNDQIKVKEHQDYLKEYCKQPIKDFQIYDFYMSSFYAVSQFQHFQLRNILYATSKHDLYMGFRDTVYYWNPYTINKKPQQVIDLSAHNSSSTNSNQNINDYPQVQMSTMCVKENILAIGGFYGELVVKDLLEEADKFIYKNWISRSSNPITNALEIYKDKQNQNMLLSSNNDSMVRIFNLEASQIVREFSLPWAVNCSTVNPVNSDLVACVGDGQKTHLIDTRLGRSVQTIEGHLDYSFAAAWSPDGSLLATGNQDCTTRVYDTRYAYFSRATLQAKVGPIRSLRFSPDGRTLAALENWDYVLLHNVEDDFNTRQSISFLGSPNGIAFSPDDGGQFFFISIFNIMSQQKYNNSNLAVFKRSKNNNNQNSNKNIEQNIDNNNDWQKFSQDLQDAD